MSMNRKHQAGLHNVGSYQVSGVPWISGSLVQAGTEYKFEFPTVAKQLILANTGSNTVRAYFNAAASGDVINGNHFLYLTAGGKSTLNVKCKEIYIAGLGAQSGVIVFAELTGIPTESMYALTGSGLTTIDGT